MIHTITLMPRWLLLWLMLLLATQAVAEVAVPPLKTRVTDLTATLTQNQQAQLDEKLRALEGSKGSQIAILLLPTTAPETIEQYAIRVAEQWQLGRKGVDDGLLIVAALQDHTLRLEVGYGLEGVVPDAVAKRVISEIMLPYFRQGDYYGGLVAGVDRLTRLIEGEPLPAPQQQPQGNHADGNTLFMLIFAAVVLAGVMRSIFGQLLGSTLVSAIIGIAAWLLFGSLIFTLIAAIFAFIFTLSSASRGGGGFGGGSFSGGGGIGGGGFSGGGGGFGGGGASGKW